DQLLTIVATRLSACVRSTDTVARLGGDEFAILLDGAPDNPELLGRRAADAIAAPCLLAGRPYQIHASFGLVTVDPVTCPTTSDTLLYRADRAMYTAKRQGHGALVIDPPDQIPPS